MLGWIEPNKVNAKWRESLELNSHPSKRTPNRFAKSKGRALTRPGEAPFLENDLRAELDLAGRSGGGVNYTSTADAKYIVVHRCLEIRVIEDVEELEA